MEGPLAKISKIEDVQPITSEKQVGIDQYLSRSETEPKTSIPLVIKHRFSDFVVHEIDNNGEMVVLTSTELPSEDLKLNKGEGFGSVLFSEEELAIINKLSESPDKNQGWVYLMDAPEEKTLRAHVHHAVDMNYKHIQTKTVTVDNKTTIQIALKNSSAIPREDKRTKFAGGNSGGYCSFVMHKSGLTTMEAINAVCRVLKLPPSLFTFAGTKDKRGVTSQRVTGFKVEATNLAKVNKYGKGNVHVGNYKYTKEKLLVGMCSGNHFEIVLRGMSDIFMSEFRARITILTKSGFINYFGLQRFGTGKVPTHFIGRAILECDWMSVFDLILASAKFDDQSKIDSLTEIRKQIKAGTFAKDKSGAIAKVKSFKGTIEGDLIFGISKSVNQSETQLLYAFKAIPRHMRVMYLHSYQSYIWNHMASERIKRYGLNLVEGDLVQSDDEIIHVTAENVSEFTIEDCVLPIVGFDSKLPGNLKGFVANLLGEDGLSVASFDHRVKEYSCKGDYRRVICRPRDLEFRVQKYSDANEDLTVSDWQLCPEGKAETAGEVKPSTSAETPAQSDATVGTAVILSFTLPSGCYATMLLRELTREDTAQSSLRAKTLAEDEGP